MRRTTRLATALATTVLLLGACGSQSESATAPGSSMERAATPAAGSVARVPAAPPSAADALPKTLVHNLADDRFVTMADVVTAGSPVLVWFWAPT